MIATFECSRVFGFMLVITVVPNQRAMKKLSPTNEFDTCLLVNYSYGCHKLFYNQAWGRKQKKRLGSTALLLRQV